MCGLIVTASFDGRPADAGLLARAANTLAHRGPDEHAVAVYDSVGFGFRRLSILDLTPAGHQPMETPDGRLVITFNGEIFNYIEIRKELERRGHSFRSSSDTEVLLYAYDEWGPDCVERLNGMWAFVILDKPRQRLVVSRDRFGIKPLYRWTDGTRLVLASEIKAILATGWCQADVNWDTAARFLCRGHEEEDTQTFFKHIDQVPQGSILEVSLTGQVFERRFWSLDAAAAAEPAVPDPAERFRELFEDCVRLRMRSDVPVGVCLSGGIDSNAILSMMSGLRPGRRNGLQAFSYIPEEFSELSYINEAIAQTGAELNELRTAPRQIWDSMPKALWHYDEPVHSPTALVGFELMRLAKSRGVTVVMNGQGADEVAAGYHSYFRAHWSDLMSAGRWREAVDEVRQYSDAQGRRFWPLLADAANHWARSAVRRRLRRSPHRFERIADGAAVHWYSPELTRRLPTHENRALASLSDLLAFSIEHRFLPLYLRIEDRNSMAHSVEARLPFLDHRLVSFVYSLPGEWKMNGPWNKHVVREAMRGVITERVRTRLDKMGFPTPGRVWFAGPWYEPVRDLLGSRTLRESGVCDVNAAIRDLDRHRAGTVDMSRGLFYLSQFGVWLQSMSWSRTVQRRANC